MSGQNAEIQFIERPGGGRLAYTLSPGAAPTVVYFCGMSTPMWDPKALAIEARCRARGTACLRFDYQGRSGSSGDYDEGTLTSRLEDARAVIDGLTRGPLVLAGYSMGGWLAFLTALAMPGRIAGLLGIAPGIDFVDWIDDRLTPEDRAALRRDGRVTRTSPDYPGEPWVTTLAMLEDAERHRILGGPVRLDCPVRLVHGMADGDAPWQVCVRTAEALTSGDVTITLLKGVGHLLRAADEVELIAALLEDLLDRVG